MILKLKSQILEITENIVEVVQVVNILNKGSIAPFEFIKSDIEKRLIAESERDFINDYIKELYSKYSIESADGNNE